MSHVLIVDDEDVVRRSFARVLGREGHTCKVASSSAEAREILGRETVELLLADLMMPGESGLDLAAGTIRDYPDTAVVMVTAAQDPKTARAAIDIGAYGYVRKPCEASELIITVANALRRRSLEIENRNHRELLEQTVQERTRALTDAVRRLEQAEVEVRSSREETIRRLSKAAEFRDNETALHIERMSRYCWLLARGAGMQSDGAELVRIATPMHDVGKIGTPDNILLKPGKLTPGEFEVMKQHAEIGYRILAGAGSELLDAAAVIAWTHHEKYDGTGYPRGLKGEETPIGGRIAAVADVFDALTSKRVYKPAMAVDAALEIMRSARGTHFDPVLFDCFLSILDRVLQVKAEFSDG